jgi:hypothetical protein
MPCLVRVRREGAEGVVGGHPLVLHLLLEPVAGHICLDPDNHLLVSGLAYEEQEAAAGVSCIAAPVFAGGSTVAALSVAVPRTRFSPAQLAPAVRTAALGLSRVLRTGG